MEMQAQPYANPICNAPTSAAAMNQQTKPTSGSQQEDSCLLRLPNEVLIKICGYLCWHCQSAKPTTQAWHEAKHQIQSLIHSPTAALASLTRTCHRLNRIANPILYHGFSAAKTANMYNFMATIRNRPELGRLVKAVFLEHVNLADKDHDAGQYNRLVEASLVSLGLWLTEDGHADRMALVRSMSHYEGLGQVIIAHLRNIERLHFELDVESALGIFDGLSWAGIDLTILHKPASVLWPHLQDCTLFVGELRIAEKLEIVGSAVDNLGDPSSFETSLEACEGLLSLAPRVSSLHLRSIMVSCRDVTVLENLTQLHLQSTDIESPDSLDQILGSIRSLQVFSFTWTHDQLAAFEAYLAGFGGITLDEVVDHLRRHHKDTLKRLQLGFPADSFDLDESIELPQLSDFTVLEELKIQGDIIPELHDVDEDNEDDDGSSSEDISLIELLPTSLRRLHIMFAGTSQVYQLLEVASDVKQPSTARRLPHLREVTVMSYCPPEGSRDNYEIYSGVCRVGWQWLRSAFGKTDVAFSTRTSSQVEWDICEF